MLNYYQTVTIKTLPSTHPIHLPARQLVVNIHFVKFLSQVVLAVRRELAAIQQWVLSMFQFLLEL